MTRKPPRSQSHREAALASIARSILGIDTMETRKRDGLDFHEIAVWNLKAALEAAYESGAGGARQEALDAAHHLRRKKVGPRG